MVYFFGFIRHNPRLGKLYHSKEKLCYTVAKYPHPQLVFPDFS